MCQNYPHINATPKWEIIISNNDNKSNITTFCGDNNINY